MDEIPVLEIGKCYAVNYVNDYERKNARVNMARVHVLDIDVSHGITTIITNRRPWNEGGTGSLDLRQIRDAVEIPKP